MARMGVFSRNDTSPDSVPRSLQLLTHRHTFDTRYMEIIPNFSEILYPNESITLQVTNFVRTLPMIRPMFSRVRVIQRFCAVPLRILWHSWEDYIKGENESQFLLEEPYIVNSTYATLNNNNETTPSFSEHGTYFNFNAFPNRPAVVPKNQPRGILLDSNGYVPSRLWPVYSDNSRNDYHSYALFGIGELGDHFNAPVGVTMGKYYDVSTGNTYSCPFSAFKFAAYQLAYSYFERQPNVQTRIDDFYEMSEKSPKEFPRFIIGADYKNGSTFMCPPSLISSDFGKSLISVPLGSMRNIASNVDESSSTYQQDVIRSSWENVEKFPLKSGANLSMLAMYNDPVTGLPTYVPSNISLTRTRFANWQTDYFTSCNPWQQRGEEAQIPLSGSASVDLAGLSVTFSGLSITGKSGRAAYTSFRNNAGNITNSGHFAGTALHDVDADPADGRGVVALNVNDRKDAGENQFIVTESAELADVLQVTGSGSASGSGSAPVSSSFYVSPSNFRFAMTLQHIKEMQAQIDNRYQSYIHKFFGARARDYRLDRPEFLGGSVMELNVSDVNQTSQTTADSDLGEVAGKSVSASTSRKIRFHADEHCVILGTLHIIPDTEYIGGLDRVDNTKDRFDWALPQFSHLSEQAVYNKELAYLGLTHQEENETVFGYEPIMNHLRWRRNFATGTFRDIFNSTGNFAEYKPWLVTRNFGFSVDDFYFKYNVPTLSDEFLSGRYGRDNSNFPITDDDDFKPFKVDSYFTERLVRVISSRGTVSRLG